MSLPVCHLGYSSLSAQFSALLVECAKTYQEAEICVERVSASTRSEYDLDLLLLGREDLPFLSAFKAGLGQKGRLIVVENAAQTATPALLQALADYWICPEPALFTFHLERLFADFCERFKAERTRIYLDTFIDALPELIWFKDIDGIHVKVNAFFCKVVGKERSNVEGYGHAHIWGLTDEEYAKSDLACKKSDERVLTTGKDDSSLEYVSSEGRVRTFLTLKSALRNSKGEIIGTVGRARDITDMRSVLAKVDLLLDNIPLAVLLTDENERVIKINDRFKEIFLPHLESLKLGQTTYSDFIQQTSELIKLLPGEVHSTEEFHTRHFHEERKLFAQSAETIIDVIRKDVLDHQNALLGSVVIFRDITMERKMTASLQKSAFIDPLTGLQNRRGFYQKIAVLPEAGDVLVYLDVDKFKQLNDVWGHESGDRALEVIADLLRRLCPMSVRFGGDEFLLYFKQISLQTVLNKLSLLAEEIKHVMRGRFTGLGFSMGVAVVEEQGIAIDEIVRNADAAMYANKRQRHEYECIQDEIKVLSTENNPEMLEALRERLQKCRANLLPYTIYKPGMQNSPDGVTRKTTR
ncbi:MAG: diguanylate cyclase [Desulfovibrio sp.]|nr:diguanylate cyclase [Desulfovibrio sp.]